ncbi:MAG: lipopolysaccharide kinase InaA family protein [Gemmataceae bacterium]
MIVLAGEKTEGLLHWQVATPYRDLLLNPDGLRLEEWLSSGAAKIVKHGPHRTVYRVDLPGLGFYIKHNRLPNARACLRGLLRPSKARMEYDRALAVAARGVPTITPLGMGANAGWKPGESWLLTLALEDAEPLNDFLESTLPGLPLARQTALRQRIGKALAALIARMHDAGIRHNDLHAGNLLLRVENDDRPRLYLVDLHAVHLGRPLGWRASRNNLVLLNHWFSMRANRADRLRFWKAYCQARAASGIVPFFAGLATPGARPELAKNLERLTWKSNLRFWRNRDRRCLANNRYYRKMFRRESAGLPGIDGMIATDLQEQAIQGLLVDHQAPFHQVGTILLKDSRSSTVAEMTMPIEGVMCSVIYKRFIGTKRWRDWLADWFRPLPVLNSWINGHGLRERCLPSPKPLAVFQIYKGLSNLDGYLVTAKIPDAVNLHDFVAGLGFLPPIEGRSSLRQSIDQLARLVREMHRRKVSHRDLKAANILVQTPRSDFQGLNVDFGPFWLIDLVGVRFHRWLSNGKKVKNLARLHASFHSHPALTRSDKLRFLRTYLQWGLFGRSEWKTWWREIERATRAKIARNERSGRPLA